MSSLSTLADAARSLSVTGTAVFPCLELGKRPLTKHGYEDATTDVATVERWWRRHPNANIGVPTGSPHFDVLDVDVRPDGDGSAALGAMAHSGLLDASHRLIRTPSGGVHLYFAGTDQPSAQLRGRHLDFKARGGYVLVPPSRGRTATKGVQSYVLLDESARPPAALAWTAVVAILGISLRPVAPAVTTTDVGHRDRLVRSLVIAPVGTRNTTLYRVTRAISPAPESVTYRAIRTAAIGAGLPAAEVHNTMRSALRGPHKGAR